MSFRTALTAVILLALVGFALRLFQIDKVSLRGDEGFTALNWVQRPLFETLNSEIVVKDPQPPLAIAAFRGWSLFFGVNEFSLRLLPALANLIGIPVMYALGKRIASRRVGTAAALLWAIHPLQIWHAQDARNYALWSAASAAALWLAMRALSRGKRVDWALYIAAAVAACYLYYLELFSVFVLNVFVPIAYWGRWRVVRRWLLSQAAVGLALAPWFLQARLLVSSGYGGTTYSFEVQRLFTWFLPSLAIGPTISENMMAALWPFILIGLVAGLVVLRRSSRQAALLLALMGTVPLLLISLVSTRLNVFTPRYVLASAEAYMLLFAALTLATGSVVRRASRSGFLLLILFLLFALGNYFFSTDYTKAPDWRTLTTYLHQQVSPDDLVVQTAADEAFTYYYSDFTATERLPANPRQTETEITEILNQRRGEYNSLWLVANPPDWPNASTPANWLRANLQPVRSANVNGLPAEQFMNWQTEQDEIERAPLAVFDKTAELLGAQIWRSDFEDDLTVWLYWRPLAETDSGLKIFVHMTAAINPANGTPIWSQDDQFPQDGRLSSQSWPPGKTFRDVYRLPTGALPSGDYTLIVGLYDPNTGARVTLADGSDNYRIGTVKLGS